ncbi:MAG: YHS domain-containing protein [Planctomycetota bacterium]|jgi:Cu+-exporting ATPase
MRHCNFNQSSKDPVCGAAISISSAPEMLCYRGKTFHFCSETCRDKFARKPGRYLGKPRHRRLPPRMSLPIGRMRACYHP